MVDSISSLFLAFFEGLVLIISPCILPVLPIILSASMQGSKQYKPVGIVVGFILSFTIFTFFSRKLVQLAEIDLTIVRNTSLMLLILFACIMFSNYLTEKFEWLTQRFANLGVTRKDYSRFEFINGVAFGALVGLIWTPCAGPILAAVILQTVLQQTDFKGFLLILAFGIGAGIPMLLIATFGNKMITGLQFFKQHSTLLRKTLAAIIMLTVVYIAFGNPLPATVAPSQNINQNRLVDGLPTPYPAPQITGIDQWLNSTPLTIAQLQGKVILIDFWAYSCINCIRTLPYAKDWYGKYHNQGFVLIGVHTPEFDFESKTMNVATAIKKYGITYPVALDNQWQTWTNFHNQYWPAHYLIDQHGNVVYTHFGEGDYDITENNIRFLLGINKPQTTSPIKAEIAGKHVSPETYLGYQRLMNFASPEAVVHAKSNHYTYPHSLSADAWALQGAWTIQAQKITASAPHAAIKIHFQGKKVFAVMGTQFNIPIKVQVLLNGKPIAGDKGQDTAPGSMLVTQHDLYRLIELQQGSAGVLELIADKPGLEVYTFTFG